VHLDLLVVVFRKLSDFFHFKLEGFITERSFFFGLFDRCHFIAGLQEFFLKIYTSVLQSCGLFLVNEFF